MPDKFKIDPQRMNLRSLPGWLVKTILIASVLPFVGFGIFMITKILHITNGKNHKIAIPFILFTLFICAIPMVGMFSAFRKLKRNPTGAAPPRAEKPWLARADWAAGKIKSSASADLRIFFLMGLGFTAIGACFMFLVLPKELSKSNYPALAVLLFPAVGIYLLVYAALQRRGQRRFGESTFIMASVPGVPGNALQGSIQTGTAFRPEEGLHLRLSCVRRSVSGAGENRQVSENILWQDEKILKNEAVSTQGDHVGIPVYFLMPTGQPESFVHGNEAIIWRLDASAKMSGPDFKAVFDLPVFNLAGAAAAQTVAPDPTMALEMPVEEIRRDEHSKIQVSNAPGGREFFFPAARSPGTAFGITVVALIFSTAVWFMIRKKAPLPFPIIFGLFSTALIFGSVNLWFKRTRVTINSTRVSAATHWLIFGGTRSFDAGEVTRFDSKIGMTSGQQVFYNIQLILRTDKKITVANLIPNKPETDWLVQEMNKAAGRAT